MNQCVLNVPVKMWGFLFSCQCFLLKKQIISKGKLSFCLWTMMPLSLCIYIFAYKFDFGGIFGSSWRLRVRKLTQMMPANLELENLEKLMQSDGCLSSTERVNSIFKWGRLVCKQPVGLWQPAAVMGVPQLLSPRNLRAAALRAGSWQQRCAATGFVQVLVGSSLPSSWVLF